MPDTPPTLSSRREFLFCYDIKMGNPNGDPGRAAAVDRGQHDLVSAP